LQTGSTLPEKYGGALTSRRYKLQNDELNIEVRRQDAYLLVQRTMSKSKSETD
jgi:hypothetical protein